MNPQEQQMNGDESAAALAFATQLQEQMMPQAEQPLENGSVEPENALGQEQPEEVKEDTTSETDTLKTEFEDFKKEIVKTLHQEIGGIRELLKKETK